MARATNTKAPLRTRRERGSITVDEIVNGAFALASEVTVDNLSMPALAKRLDLGVTSIYWHFRSKDLLLDAMTDRALFEFNDAMPEIYADRWYDALREHARAMYSLYRHNPVMCDLLVLRPRTAGLEGNVTTYQRLEEVVTRLLDAGFNAGDALDAILSTSFHARSSALFERMQELETDNPARVAAAAINSDTMPNLAALMESGHSLSGVEEHLFEVSLDALVERARKVLRATNKAKTLSNGSNGAAD